MNVNIHLTLTERDRNLIARKIAGKDIKRLCSRSDVVQMVEGFMAGYLAELSTEFIKSAGVYDAASGQPNAGMSIPRLAQTDLSLVPEKYADESDSWKVSYLRGRYGR
jgi:hypothetical protein